MNKPSLNRILLVEDEPHLQMVTRVTLERVGGFQVSACASGQEAIKEARRFHPDLILLDVMMPGMDGVTTLRLLRSAPETADIAVVFMTARAQKTEVEAYIELGALGVVTKPFDPMTLPALLREIWEKPSRNF
jgi:CheY-like chemotaxis protein